VQPTLAPVLTEHANASSPRCMPADEPLRTICAQVKGGHHALITAHISSYYSDKRPDDVRGAELAEPLATQPTENRHALVSAFLAKHYTGVVGSDVVAPIGTVTSVDHHSLVASHLVKLRGTSSAAAADAPLGTISAGGLHHAEVRAFLIKYYSEGGQWQDMREPMHTVPTKDRLGLVTIRGEDYAIVDIGMRMLTPRELARAQGFPDSYILDPIVNGKQLSKSAQVRMIGNSVCPPLAAALVQANMAHELQIARAA
jgi:DNA (cytosine-5)-methyltransferase 1